MLSVKFWISRIVTVAPMMALPTVMLGGVALPSGNITGVSYNVKNSGTSDSLIALVMSSNSESGRDTNAVCSACMVGKFLVVWTSPTVI